MKRHPPTHSYFVYPSPQTGAGNSCDSTIRPPTQPAHAQHTYTCTHTSSHHIHIHRPFCLLSNTVPAWIHIPLHTPYTPHTHVAEAGASWEANTPIAADQSMSSFSQWGRIIHAGAWEQRQAHGRAE